MSIEENVTPEPTETPAPDAGAQPAEKPGPGYVKRSLLEESGAREKAIQARLDAYESAEAARKQKELEDAENWKGLLETEKETSKSWETKYNDSVTKTKQLELKQLLISENFQDPTGLAIDGAMSKYDGSDPNEWIKGFKESNPKAFEVPAQEPQNRSVSANAHVASGAVIPEMEKISAGYKAGDEWAIKKVQELARNNKLPDHMARDLKLIR